MCSTQHRLVHSTMYYVHLPMYSYVHLYLVYVLVPVTTSSEYEVPRTRYQVGASTEKLLTRYVRVRGICTYVHMYIVHSTYEYGVIPTSFLHVYICVRGISYMYICTYYLVHITVLVYEGSRTNVYLVHRYLVRGTMYYVHTSMYL